MTLFIKVGVVTSRPHAMTLTNLKSDSSFSTAVNRAGIIVALSTAKKKWNTGGGVL